MSFATLLSFLFGIPALAATVQTQPADRNFEGDWYVLDKTNNNTGEREVEASVMYVKGDEPDYVTVNMRCLDTQPIIFVEWNNITFPDQTVLAIGPITGPDDEIEETSYIFQKSTDPVHRGLRATPAVSRSIITAMGQVKHTTVSAHVGAQPRFVMLAVEGTQRAWSRVARHCPAPVMPRPPK